MQDLYGLGASGVPLEYSSQMRALQQQQMIAQSLLSQSQEPLQNQAPGVAVSPLQGLAKIAQAYVGAKGMRDANQGMQGAATKYNDDQSAAVQKVIGAMAPRTLPDSSAGAPATMPRTVEEQRAALVEPLMSQYPNVRNFATSQTSLLNQRENREDTQQSRMDVIEAQNKQRAHEKDLAVDETKRREIVAAEEKAKDRESAKELRQLVIDSRKGSGADKGDKTPSGYRYKQDGSLEPIPGGPADQKQTTALSGRETVSSIVGSLRDSFDQLSEGGGIVDTKKGFLSNIAAGAGSSGIGQAVGKMTGTGNQSQRNSIAMTRPLLLQAIMKATGMSAKQMDSNTELKLYLSTATDPTLDVAANRRALDKLESLYGIGGQESPKGAAPSPSKGGAKFLGFE